MLGDRYRALQPLSQEGIGRTFLAVDERDAAKPRCIIKQLSPRNQGINNPKAAAESSRQEAARLAELGQHPQIPQLLAYFEQQEQGETGGTVLRGCPAPALVQAYIDGQSLDQKLETEGAFSETEIRQLLNELLPILQFVHDKGVIHRDINPDNIIRRRSDGQLVLVDFSAAKFTTKTALAKTGTLIGSAAYTAPEQLMGKAETSSDLYSLGVTCVHLLTQIHPFDLFNSLEGIWVWQDYLCDPISHKLRHILNKMLESAIQRRYQTANDILRHLNPDTNPKTLIKSVQFAALSSPTELKTLTPTWHCIRTLTGHASSINALALTPDGRTLVSGSADRTVKLWNPDSRIPRATFSGHSSLIHALALTPDGRTLASGSWDYTINLWDLETGELVETLYEHFGWIQSLAITSDGKCLASASADRTIKLWNLETNQVQTTLWGHSGAVHCVAISPDGQILVSGGADKTIKLWDLSSGKIKLTLDGHSDTVNSLTFSPSGHILISGSADKTIKIWNLGTGVLLHTLDGHTEAVNYVAINLQGNMLISGSSDKMIKIWHPGSGERLHTLSDHSAGVTAVAIAPDGQLIASGSQDKTIKIWKFE